MKKEVFERRMGVLISRFSKLEGWCVHPQETKEVEGLFREMKSMIEELADLSPSRLQAALGDLQLRVAMWHRVWPRLGSQAPFRNAVAREAQAWSNKLAIFSKET